MGVEGRTKGNKGFIPGVYYLLEITWEGTLIRRERKWWWFGGGNVAIAVFRSSFRINKRT